MSFNSLKGVALFGLSIGLVRKLKLCPAMMQCCKTLSRGLSTLPGAEDRTNTIDSSAKSPRKKSSIYTRTGDKGTSSLYSGERRSKTDLTFEALGNSDEVNAAIGIAREYCALTNNGIESMLIEIQCRLFDVGSAIATPIASSSEEKLAYVKFSSAFTIELERCIDELDAQLPPLKNFVIPSGGLSSVYLNHARTICRRAERSVIPLIERGDTDPEVGKYLNRLSDFLFVAARFAAKTENKIEITWQKPKSSE